MVVTRLGYMFIGVGLPGVVNTVVKRWIGRVRPSAAGPFAYEPFSWRPELRVSRLAMRRRHSPHCVRIDLPTHPSRPVGLCAPRCGEPRGRLCALSKRRDRESSVWRFRRSVGARLVCGAPTWLFRRPQWGRFMPWRVRRDGESNRLSARSLPHKSTLSLPVPASGAGQSDLARALTSPRVRGEGAEAPCHKRLPPQAGEGREGLGNR